MRKVELTSESEEQTRRIATAMASHLQPGDVIALEGPLGSGKTCFVRGLAEGLGINPRSVSSPTFIICQEYGASRGSTVLSAMRLIHIDAYRLNGPDDLESIGWHELIESGDAVIAIEWPSRIGSALPEERIEIDFQHEGPDERLLAVRVPPGHIEMLEHLQSVTEGSRSGPAGCRTCGKPVDRGASTFPFCSERCRLADLGKWFNEGYRMSRPVEEDEELEE